MSSAYACRISANNIGAIASEKPNFSLKELNEWCEEHGNGYFIRDENAPWDCTYMSDVTFEEIYAFVYKDYSAIFREVRMRE